MRKNTNARTAEIVQTWKEVENTAITGGTYLINKIIKFADLNTL